MGGPGLHQKVPLRNYLGLTLIDKEEIVFENFGTYDSFSGSFVLFDVKQEHIDKLKTLQTMISDTLGKKIGLKVGILNELPRRTGLNNPGTNAANLSVAYLLLTGQIELSDLKDFQNISATLETDKRDLLVSVAKRFHSIWLGRKSAGFGVLANMVSFPDILVYNPRANYPVLPLRNIFKPEVAGELPFDIVIIGTSDRYDIDFSLRRYDEVGDLFSISDSDVKQFEEAFKIDEPRAKNFSVELRKSYFQAVSETGLAAAIVAGKFIENPNIENQKLCLQVFNSSYDMINLFGQNFSRKEKVHSFIRKYFHEVQPDIPFALTTGITNNLILVTPKDSTREYLDKLIEYVNSKISFEISLPFISWLDENDEEGVVVEKWDKIRLQPTYLPSGCLYLYSLAVMETNVSLVAIDNRETLETEYDILLDEDDKRIYVNGKRVTSRELPTVAATINLFTCLFSASDLTVSSFDLPDQSYFIDRNELQSKIVSPLKIYVEKTLGKHLNLKISGNIADYKVTLFSSDLKIGLIKRI